MMTAHAVLARWNTLDSDTAADEILPCCGSARWAREMVLARPIDDENKLIARSEEIWMHLAPDDWTEAFLSHPRIGERNAAATKQSSAWSQQEQSGADAADAEIRAALEQGNLRYEERFGRVFLVCATGKSAEEMLTILECRLQNDSQTELREAVEQQRQITRLRLRKWLNNA